MTLLARSQPRPPKTGTGLRRPDPVTSDQMWELKRASNCATDRSIDRWERMPD